MVREITTSDQGQLIQLMEVADNRQPFWAIPRIKKALEQKSPTIFVAEQGNMMGYVGVVETANDSNASQILGEDIYAFAHLTWLAVDPKYRHQGIARDLIVKAEEWAQTQGKAGLWLDCRQSLISFYENLGYRNAGNYLDDNKPRYLFVKKFNVH